MKRCSKEYGPKQVKQPNRKYLNKKVIRKLYSHSILTTPNLSDNIFEPMEDLKFKGRTLWMMRSFTNADYSEKVILSKSIFNFVDSWLLKKATPTHYKFLNYWHQAKDYYAAGVNTKSEVKPLLNYYCCLNMVKCLLNLNGIDVENIDHGVGWHQSPNVTLEDQRIDFAGRGAHNELRKLLGEGIGKASYSLKDLLYNLVCIHRAYSYTYPSEDELFVNLESLKFQKKGKGNMADPYQITVAFDISKRESGIQPKMIPSVFEQTTRDSADWALIKGKSRDDRISWGLENGKPLLRWRNALKWNDNDLIEKNKDIILNVHKKVRPYFQYISAETPIWYLKKEDFTNRRILGHSSLVISLGVMHCLSEMVRYKPDLYSQLLRSNCGWLLTEFIEVGMDQFVDEIASEITGLNIMMSGIRGKR